MSCADFISVGGEPLVTDGHGVRLDGIKNGNRQLAPIRAAASTRLPLHGLLVLELIRDQCDAAWVVTPVDSALSEWTEPIVRGL